MKRSRKFVLGLVALAALATAQAANAGIFRAYLSVNGNDINPCTLPQPCRLLPAALAAVNDGGEIWMLDSANFNSATVAISKSVTILAVPGALGSVVSNNGDAIVVSAAGAIVTLRNLVVLGLTAGLYSGVNVVQASAVTVEGCEIYGMAIGINDTAPGSKLTIKGSTVRDHASSAIKVMGALTASLQNVNLINNATGLTVIGGATATVSNSMVVGSSAIGVDVSAGGGTSTLVTLSSSTLSGNATGVRAGAFGPPDIADVMLNNVAVTDNFVGVLLVGPTAKASTRQNNAFLFNGTDVSGGALTPQVAQ